MSSFQYVVEIQEASHIYASAGNANVQNRLQAVQELKGTLGTWRDRLPNQWEDINVWSELVSWRQHVFGVINKSYQNIPDLQTAGNSLAFRGYHEIAWIVNKFAHTARKHHLVEACTSALTKIYTLPNIEIQDAFLKLREQAKCYLHGNTELVTGLDVINNTNLSYFQVPQRAEFFALKGEFLGKLGLTDDANAAFSAAIQIDSNLAKAWCAWGQYNDQVFKQSRDANHAANAVNCYLHASGLYKGARCRKYIARIIWLLGHDDASGIVYKAFEYYKGDVPIWYYISFIPHLLSALARPEARHAKNILIKIAKAYPQALYTQLRFKRETLTAQPTVSPILQSPGPELDHDMDGIKAPFAHDVDDSDVVMTNRFVPPSVSSSADNILAATASKLESMVSPVTSRKSPLEYVEDIMAILKTAFPLLALSMETMVDQILARLKPTPDEEVYRIVFSLLTDGYNQLVSRILDGTIYENNALSPSMSEMIVKFINSPFVSTSKHGAELQHDFITSKPNLEQVVVKFRYWRTKLEHILDNRPSHQNLQHFSPYLIEFEYQKFDDVEVPGQYMALRDSNENFVKIERFVADFECVRGHGTWNRRITLVGQDGSHHVFSVQNPAPRHSGREDNIGQLLRLLGTVLDKKGAARRRDLTLLPPQIIQLSPTVRLVQDDVSNVSLQQIYEQYCCRKNYVKDEPIMQYWAQLKTCAQMSPELLKTENGIHDFNLEMFATVRRNWAQDGILCDYFRKSMQSYTDYWLLRKQFTQQLAVNSLMSYALSIGKRQPHTVITTMSTGRFWLSDAVPAVDQQLKLHTGDAVPFRLTPAMQQFIGRHGIEGWFIGAVMAAGTSLSQPEFDVESVLGIYILEEMLTHRKPNMSDKDFNDVVQHNIDLVVSRISELSCTVNRSVDVPLCQPILDKIAQATNSSNLCAMGPFWQPWL